MRKILAIAVCMLAANELAAREPNDYFFVSTVLPAGTLSVSDDLVPAVPPDTLLGIQNQFGGVYFVDDDSSPIGSGTASGVGGAPTNSGSIDFVVSGYGDESFSGSHSEYGAYRVHVDVYDFFDDLVDSFTQERTLEPGAIEEFSFSDGEWIGGSYDVYIDNTIAQSAQSDVDYFTFTGLTPGSSFTAQTLSPGVPSADTFMGWFSSAGAEVATDDDSGVNALSLISGVVPGSGDLTFAVTAGGDVDFTGNHVQTFAYQLQVTLGGASLPADFNNDHAVNGLDLAAWKGSFGPGATADADEDGDSDGNDFLLWQRGFGSAPAMATAIAAPEPAAALLMLSTLAGVSILTRSPPQ